MSSPMVSKDTLYHYIGDGGDGSHFLGFLYADKFSGWSMYLRDGRSWQWSQSRPYKGNPIGQRCILQW